MSEMRLEGANSRAEWLRAVNDSPDIDHETKVVAAAMAMLAKPERDIFGRITGWVVEMDE